MVPGRGDLGSHSLLWELSLAAHGSLLQLRASPHVWSQEFGIPGAALTLRCEQTPAKVKEAAQAGGKSREKPGTSVELAPCGKLSWPWPAAAKAGWLDSPLPGNRWLWAALWDPGNLHPSSTTPGLLWGWLSSGTTGDSQSQGRNGSCPTARGRFHGMGEPEGRRNALSDLSLSTRAGSAG